MNDRNLSENDDVDFSQLKPDDVKAIQAHILDLEEALVFREPAKVAPHEFIPETYTAESLITNRIATASSASVASQASIAAALAKLAHRDDTSFSFDDEMARAVAHGKMVRFRDADEKARILALAEEHARETTRKRNLRKLSKLGDSDKMDFEDPLPVDFQQIPKKNRKDIVNKVLKGNYAYGNTKLKGVAFDTKFLDLNGTFTPRGFTGFLDIVKRFFPGARTAKK